MSEKFTWQEVLENYEYEPLQGSDSELFQAMKNLGFDSNSSNESEEEKKFRESCLDFIEKLTKNIESFQNSTKKNKKEKLLKRIQKLLDTTEIDNRSKKEILDLLCSEVLSCDLQEDYETELKTIRGGLKEIFDSIPDDTNELDYLDTDAENIPMRKIA